MTTEDKHGHDAKKTKDELKNNSKPKTKEELDIKFRELSSKLRTILNKPTVELKKEAISKPDKCMQKSKEELDREFKELSKKLKTIMKKQSSHI
ncbi:MAG: hypothetical protein ACD_13C00029G0003 [uncultured bacterium]|nr:MAG: hypothetical protein ACD_13C00029G0003 [uncultured bacterium]